MPDINLVYRKSTTPTTNTATAFKGSPLTNDELDNNFYGTNVEMLSKAPINNAVFTGTTTIPSIIASGGTINGTIIGGTSAAAGTFTDVVTTGNLTVGDATGDTLTIRAGTALLPALTTAGDLNTGMWFPAADTIAYSTNGAERVRFANAGLTLTGSTTAATSFFRITDNAGTPVTKFLVDSSSGNTTVSGTLGVTGAATLSSTLGVTGTTTLAAVSATTGSFTNQVTSTLAIGTAPLVVTSTTKVSNLNVDKVDGLDFNTVNTSGTPGTDQIGGVVYAVSASTIGYVPPGTSGHILRSNGVGTSPTWIAATGLSAGSSLTAANITGGTAGQLLYQGDVDTTNKLPIGASNTVLTSSGSVPQWSTSLSLSGTISHAGLSPSAGTGIDQLYTVTDAALTVTTGWVDTSVNAAELAAGSYMVQVTTGAGATLEFHTGVMSWFSGDANTATSDEIVLHRASSGSVTSNLFLRVFRSATVTTDMILQISSSVSRASASYTYKFRRML